MATSFADLKAKAKPAVRSVDVCVDRSLNTQHDKLNAELAAETKRQHQTLEDGGNARDLAEQIQALEQQMVDARERIWLQSISERAFVTIIDEHPPRDGNARDASRGWNYETFPPAIIAATVIDPPEGEDGLEHLTVEQASELFHDILSAGDAGQLLTAATIDNVVPSNVPFSALASVTLRETEQS